MRQAIKHSAEKFKDKGSSYTHHMMGVAFIFSKLKTRGARMLALMIVFMLFALVWGELAVGLFGKPWAGN